MSEATPAPPGLPGGVRPWYIYTALYAIFFLTCFVTGNYILTLILAVVGGFAAEYFVPSAPGGDRVEVNGSSSSVTSDQQQQGVTREPSFYDKPLPPEPPQSEPSSPEPTHEVEEIMERQSAEPVVETTPLRDGDMEALNYGREYGPPPTVRDPSPEPIRREPSPEPVRQPSPEPVREPSPEPFREPSPEPIREPSPEPIREPSPEPVRQPSPDPIREPSPEPIREPSPEPIREPSPEPIREPSPESFGEPSPEPIREPSPEPVPPKQESPVSEFGVSSEPPTSELSGPSESLLMERKVSEEVMESLDKFRLKGKEEEESDSDESFQNETETKADPYSLEGSAPKSQDPFPSDPSPGPQRELSPEPKSQDPFPNDPSPGPQRELSPEPHKPASPELFGQESPEPPKTQYSGISLEPEVIQEQPKHQDQLAAFESRDPSADLLGDNFQQDQQQQQPSVPQGVDPLLDFGQTSSNTAAPAASAFPDSQLSDLVDFGSGTAGGMTATPQDSNTDLEASLKDGDMEALNYGREYGPPPTVRDPSPEPMRREPSPEPVRQLSPEPVREPSPVKGTDSLEDLMQQQQKSPVAKNDSFEKIGSDDDDDDEKDAQRGTFLTEVEIPADAETSEDVSDLLRDAQKESPEMNVRVSVEDPDSDSDSELAEVKQKVEDEGDPWVAGSDNDNERPSENLLLSAKSESSGGGAGGGDDISQRAVFGDDEEQDAKGLSSAEDNSSKAGSGDPAGRGGSIGSAEEVDCDVNLQPDAAVVTVAPAAAAPSGGGDVDIDLSDPMVQEATAKIQAAFKGFKTRQSLKKERD